MTAPSLSVEDRKLLTEFLGEKHHQYYNDVDSMYAGMLYVKCSCGFKGRLTEWEVICNSRNRTFLTYQDLGDLFTELQKRGWWREFAYYAELRWVEQEVRHYIITDYRFHAWLFNPERIGLIAEFIRPKVQ